MHLGHCEEPVDFTDAEIRYFGQRPNSMPSLRQNVRTDEKCEKSFQRATCCFRSALRVLPLSKEVQTQKASCVSSTEFAQDHAENA